jgi:hypothetical protein
LCPFFLPPTFISVGLVERKDVCYSKCRLAWKISFPGLHPNFLELFIETTINVLDVVQQEFRYWRVMILREGVAQRRHRRDQGGFPIKVRVHFLVFMFIDSQNGKQVMDMFSSVRPLLPPTS